MHMQVYTHVQGKVLHRATVRDNMQIRTNIGLALGFLACFLKSEANIGENELESRYNFAEYDR